MKIHISTPNQLLKESKSYWVRTLASVGVRCSVVSQGLLRTFQALSNSKWHKLSTSSKSATSNIFRKALAWTNRANASTLAHSLLSTGLLCTSTSSSSHSHLSMCKAPLAWCIPRWYNPSTLKHPTISIISPCRTDLFRLCIKSHCSRRVWTSSGLMSSSITTIHSSNNNSSTTKAHFITQRQGETPSSEGKWSLVSSRCGTTCWTNSSGSTTKKPWLIEKQPRGSLPSTSNCSNRVLCRRQWVRCISSSSKSKNLETNNWREARQTPRHWIIWPLSTHPWTSTI